MKSLLTVSGNVYNEPALGEPLAQVRRCFHFVFDDQNSHPARLRALLPAEFTSRI